MRFPRLAQLRTSQVGPSHLEPSFLSRHHVLSLFLSLVSKVLQGKSFCTLARSASDPKQQLAAYLKALGALAERFERVDCLVEMGEWATGRGLALCGADYLRSALDLLYDVEVG